MPIATSEAPQSRNSAENSRRPVLSSPHEVARGPEVISNVARNVVDNKDADIIVVGAGLAGVTAASILGRRWRVTVVDPRPSCPPVFRAEKIEPDQAVLLRQLGLLQTLLPAASRIREIQSYYNGRLRSVTPTEQYGLHYSVMVNSLRDALPKTVQLKLGRVVQIANREGLQSLTLDGGEQLTCRLVVLACGLNAGLIAGLRMKRVTIQKRQCFSLAFTLVRPNGQPFSFDSLTYTLTSARTGIDYISFFPINETKRANLFAFPARDNAWLQRLVRDPNRELLHILPKLSRAIGDYRIIGRVETSLVDLYRTDGDPPPGIVLIGDASQNVCPSTGMGLTKIFTDVDVLSDCVPRWFETEGMAAEKLQTFFRDPRKNAADARALRAAYYRRNACSARSLRWRIHRSRLHLSMQLGRS